MALQTSGQIKISEIKTELGSTSNSLRALSAAAGFSTPDAMSEFYGYSSSQPSTKFWKFNGSNDRLVWRDSTPAIATAEQQMSFSFWFRIDLASKDNLLFFDLYPQGTGSNANRFFLNYSASLNRFVARYRSNSSNFDRQWGLHDNSTETGITNSSTGLSTAQRGNVNGDNFCHIVLTYDGTIPEANEAFKCYWNGRELRNTSAANNGGRTTFDFTEITWGNDYNSGTGDASGYDEMRIYNTVLSQGEIDAIYNSGSPLFSSSDGVTQGLIFEDRAEASTPVDSAGQWSRYISSGTLTNL